MLRRVLVAIAVAAALLGAACGPDEPAGPDLSRFAAPVSAGEGGQ